LSELKCCRLCPAYSTCTHKGECCPECPYFDPEEGICLAPESAKKPRKIRVRVQKPKEVDPETFLFEDDEEEEEIIEVESSFGLDDEFETEIDENFDEW